MKALAACLAVFCVIVPAYGSAVRDLQRALGVDDSQWKIEQEDELRLSWSTKSNEAVTLAIGPPRSGLPDPKNAKALQDFHRGEAKAARASLVEATALDVPPGAGELVTVKFQTRDFVPAGVSGWGYHIEAILPTATTTVILQVAALEGSPTGMREAVVQVADMKERGLTSLADEAAIFRKDPYDPQFDSEAKYVLSDARRWDKGLPQHPLSRVRAVMDSILASWTPGDAVLKNAWYKPPANPPAPAPILALGSTSFGETVADVMRRAQSKQQTGDTAGAIAEYSHALELDPKFVPALGNRGNLLRGKGDLDGAIADYNRILAVNPKEALAFFNRGLARRAKGDLDGAIADLDQYVVINPKDGAGFANRGGAKLLKRDNEGAIADFDQAIVINPKDAGAYYLRATAKDAKSDYEGELADLSSSLELNPRNAEAYSRRGALKLRKMDLDGAIADFDQALAVDPKNAKAAEAKAATLQAKAMIAAPPPKSAP